MFFSFFLFRSRTIFRNNKKHFHPYILPKYFVPFFVTLFPALNLTFTRDLDWSIDNSMLLSAAEDGTARLWHCDRGTCLRVISSSHPFTSVRFQPGNNNVCVAADDEGVVRGFNLSTGKPLSGERGVFMSGFVCNPVYWRCWFLSHVYVFCLFPILYV